ncbi:MAG: FAD-binding domain-containing protein [Woeseiaceae bacterium]|nr:FAD-binding domain-containing protein [Woeseiaceae bacterium]
MPDTESGVASRAAGLIRLDEFSGEAALRYQKQRNFDRGPERRDNVSMLSPFLRHRLILEREVLTSVLARHSATAVSRYVEEVFWRAYYKGWLEQRPTVWSTYRADVGRLLTRLDADKMLLERYETAVAGRTGIDCFDVWARELVDTGYLHNHTRMWFASIWVFTLELPWQLGADFFYRHLVDGDPASNTLSWRWVCGLHTRGKTYLARASNISKCTDNRFHPRGLSPVAEPLTEAVAHSLKPLPTAQVAPRGERYGLLITEEDCNPESLALHSEPVAIAATSSVEHRSPLPVGQIARAFTLAALEDTEQRAAGHFGAAVDSLAGDDLASALLDWAGANDLDQIVTAYCPVGPAAERLATAREKLIQKGIRLIQLRRGYDSRAWPHATAGYFKLKSRIPMLLEHLEADVETHAAAS